jgi:hypothetical protein
VVRANDGASYIVEDRGYNSDDALGISWWSNMRLTPNKVARSKSPGKESYVQIEKDLSAFKYEAKDNRRI